MALNGKNAGGGMLINPYGVMNDGLIEFFFSDENLKAMQLVKLLDKANK